MKKKKRLKGSVKFLSVDLNPIDIKSRDFDCKENNIKKMFKILKKSLLHYQLA